MFQRLLRPLCIAAALATGGTLFTAAPAAAETVRFGITIGHGGIHAAPVHYHHRDRSCSPRDAVRRAGQIGLRHARVVAASERGIKVTGRSRGDRTSVWFSRRAGCPIIRIRG